MSMKLKRIRVWPVCVSCNYDEFLRQHEFGCPDTPDILLMDPLPLIMTREVPESEWVYDFVTEGIA